MISANLLINPDADLPSDWSTPYGQDKAARIWYKAIADYMTASTKYAGARVAAVNAATALVGQNGITSSDVDAVKAAFSAINVN